MTKSLPLFVLMLAGTVAGQATKPATIAQLKDENAKLRAEVADLRARLQKFELVAVPAASDFPNLAAFLKWLPRDMVSGFSDSELQQEEKARQLLLSAAKKTITIRGQLISAKAESNGSLRVRLRQNVGDAAHADVVAVFDGTDSERKRLATIDRGQLFSVSGAIDLASAIQSDRGFTVDGEQYSGLVVELRLTSCVVDTK